MTTAQVLSNAIDNPLYRERRPPPEWGRAKNVMSARTEPLISPGTARHRSFGFARARVARGRCRVCGVTAAAVAAERVHSGAHNPTDAADGSATAITAASLARSALHCHGHGCCDER